MIGLVFMSLRWMIKLMAVFLVLSFAIFGWTFLGIGLLLTPDKAAMSRSLRQFNRSVSRAVRHAL